MAITRRQFIKQSAAILAATSLFPPVPMSDVDQIMTVRGWLPARQLGFTLTHEHIMVDFIGADKVDPSRYDATEVYEVALPHVQNLRAKGCRSLVECTPAYLGRDVRLLKRLSDQTGLHFVTNTGYYGAAGEKHLPPQAYTATAGEIAEIWIKEWRDGIGDTRIRPGFIKCGVDRLPLSDVQSKMIEAAAITHLATGLSIGIHTGDGLAALEELNILSKRGVDPRAWIWIHAQNEKNRAIHLQAASAGGWVSFDNIHKDSLADTLIFIKDMKKEKLLDHVLLSHDAGWYHVGEKNGGNFTGYTFIADTLIPAMHENGFSHTEIDQLFVHNPAKAFTVRVRKIHG
jgi:predicted metal-dependent phosphotriesterase family hydrolase